MSVRRAAAADFDRFQDEFRLAAYEPKETFEGTPKSVSGFFTLTPGGVQRERQLPTHCGRNRLSQEAYGFRHTQLKGVAHRDRLSPSLADHGLAIVTDR